MKKHYVIINYPVKFPIQSTILYAFLLYHFNLSGIWWGIFITLYSIYWVVAIAIKWNEERIDLNEEKPSLIKKKFAERLKQFIDEKSKN